MPISRLTIARRRAVAGLGALVASAAIPRAGAQAPFVVRTGFAIARRAAFAPLRERSLGLIANPTSIDGAGTHIADILHDADGISLNALFGPEHGFRGAAQAGKSEVKSIDPRTGLPVFDIYAKAGPALEAIFRESGVDAVMFDIQDVGVRFYTYTSTLFDTLVACARLGCEVIVLDRPNPITGDICAGPVMQPAYESFVGRAAIPIRHGMTMGELAQMFNAQYVPFLAGRSARLQVIALQG